MKTITLQEYEEAIITIKLAMTQLEPDGYNCAICGDNDHQAWECRHNPITMAKKGEK